MSTPNQPTTLKEFITSDATLLQEFLDINNASNSLSSLNEASEFSKIAFKHAQDNNIDLNGIKELADGVDDLSERYNSEMTLDNPRDFEATFLGVYHELSDYKTLSELKETLKEIKPENESTGFSLTQLFTQCAAGVGCDINTPDIDNHNSYQATPSLQF